MNDAREMTLRTSTKKRKDLLDILLRRKVASASSRLKAGDIEDSGSHEMSFAQYRLWFLQQMEPDSSLYNMTGVWSLEGLLDVDLLVGSIREIVRRHESLRTVFATDGGDVHAVITPATLLSVPLIDMGDRPATERDSWIQESVACQAEQSFNLESGPLIRVALLRVHARMHVLVVVMHHIVSDGWSFRVFRKELQALYTAGKSRRPAPLAELAVQYADYARRQRRGVDDEKQRADLAYWRTQLAGASSLELIPDRPRPPRQSYRGAHIHSIPAASVVGSLRRIGRESQCSLFMVLLAGFGALLHRLTGQRDICVGIPVANRERPELEDLIGFFVNTLVIRADFSSDPTFRELLRRVRRTTLDAYAHQDVPFEGVVREIAPERDLSRNPLFQVFFNMDSSDDEPLELPGLTVGRIDRRDVKSKFDLTLYVRDRRGQIRFDLVYSSDLFEGARMAEMLAQLEHFLKRVGECPDERIAAVRLLTPGARQALPNPTSPLASRWSGFVGERVAEHAAGQPVRVAATDGVQIWTYAELDAVSNRLAACLQANGIRQTDVVAVYGGRTISLVASLLGILRSGAAFIILDSSYPARRLHDCLHVAKPRGWLELWTGAAVPEVLVDASRSIPCRLQLPEDPRACELLAKHAVTGAAVEIDPDEPAYVAFTSGSTHSRPRAVLGTHRPLSHFLQWHCRTFGLRPSDRFAMLSGLSHDPLLRDIFTPLWLGATLCVPRQADMERPWHLARWMAQEEITVAHVTPPLADVLSSQPEGSGPEPVRSLRYVFFGGDRLAERHVHQMEQMAPNATCVNFYGTTETPQAMGYHVVSGQQGDGGPSEAGGGIGHVPIGRGIEGAQLLVMNEASQLAGIAERGEICVRTPYLTRGYVDDDACTAARFISNPFTADVGDRLYRTGDSGFYRADGCVVFCGRMDRQMKLRGFRIEPAEIESALCSHPAIGQAVVVPDGDEQTGKRLTAYIVSDGSISTLSLRAWLREFLPEHMIPVQFVVLDALPLTPNGKVDLVHLRRCANLPGNEICHAPASTVMEKKVAEIWREVIGVSQIGQYDNFFDLGGHSLLVVNAVARLEKDLGIRVPFKEFFAQTLSQFAAYCETKLSLERSDG